MSHDLQRFARPQVNQGQLQKRLQLQMALMWDDARLRNFTPERDRLAAAGRDANAAYRELRSHRDRLAAEVLPLVRPTRPAARPSPARVSPSAPLSPGRLLGGSFSPWGGYAGQVQLESALVEDAVFPPGTMGTLETLALDGHGGIYFGGDIAAMPVPGHPTNPGTYVESDQYFWLQNWSYLIPFPAPVVESRLTYSFQVLAQVATLIVDEQALGWSFVSVGEYPDLMAQRQFVADTSVGFPLPMASLSDQYLTQGQLSVQRSFVVGAGRVPVVAVILGFSAGLAPRAEVVLDDGLDCFLVPGSSLAFYDIDGNPSFTGDEGLVTFRYDPLPPASTSV